MTMGTDPKSTFDEGSSMKLVGYDMTKLAVEKLFNAVEGATHVKDIS